jgi:hypothetical protein
MTVSGTDLIAAIEKLGWVSAGALLLVSIGVAVGFLLLNKRIGDSETRLTSSLGREDYRFTKLLERRVDIVCDVYKRLVALHQHVVALVQPMEFAGAPSKQDRAATAQGSLDEFNAVYYPNRIWLDAAAVAAVDAFVKELLNAALKFQTAQATDSAETWIAAWEQADKKAAPALNSIEELLRGILLGSPQES